MKGRGINNLPEFLDSSPSPQPFPIKGEGRVGVMLLMPFLQRLGKLNQKAKQAAKVFGRR
jgi:hypothetical protein